MKAVTLFWGNIQVNGLEGMELAVVEVPSHVPWVILEGPPGGEFLRLEGMKVFLAYFCRVKTRARILSPRTATVIRNTPAQARCCQFS